MKVGIDARTLSRPLTGIGNYTLEMCKALAKLPDIDLYLYSPNVISCDLSGLESVFIKTKHWNNSILRQIWSETYLPLWAKNDDIDVFWGPSHRLPRWLPKHIARVVTIHDLVWKYAGKSMRLFSRFLEIYFMPVAVRLADKIVVDSQATLKSVQDEFAVQADRLVCVPLGKKHKEILPSNFTRSYFLFVGTLEPRKNLLRLIFAYSQLSETLRNKTHFIIAGGKGWGKIDIFKTIEKLGLEKNIQVLGYVDESKLCELYANCLFLAMPSLYEGFGLPLVDAMSYGKPVLTSNNSSMPEVAGDAGYFVNPLSIDSICEGLQKLIGDDKLRNELASHAKDNAAKFDWQLSAKKLVNVFQEVIDNKFAEQK